jgi:hypothetical protein
MVTKKRHHSPLGDMGSPGAWSSRFARGPEKGSDHLGSLYTDFTCNFCKRLFPQLEPVTSSSQGNSFYHCAKAPLRRHHDRLKIEINRRLPEITQGSGHPRFCMMHHIEGVKCRSNNLQTGFYFLLAFHGCRNCCHQSHFECPPYFLPLHPSAC